MSKDLVIGKFALGFPWQTFDPFLFCVFHDDAYPAGNEEMGPKGSLAGRNIGNDFAARDGWNMYHGDVVPGFPRHPHRGFETVSIVRAGVMDHSDSLGATARFAKGDVQWMTAGSGIVHSEMFPLLERDMPNPAGLFQIWINLPAASKMVPPHFSMLWNEDIPQVERIDESGATTKVCIVAGSLGDYPKPPPPPPDSWAADPANEVAMLTITMEPGATFSIPPASASCHRTLYFFRGDSVQVGETTLTEHGGARLRSDAVAQLKNGPAETEILILQGRPIAEPVASYGPFVMNTSGEIQQAISDFRRTEFGGWPWPVDGPVHAREEGRFALHTSGEVERPDS